MEILCIGTNRPGERGRKSVRVCGKDNEVAYQWAKWVPTCGTWALHHNCANKSQSPGNTAWGEVVAACQGAYSTRSPRHRGGGGGVSAFQEAERKQNTCVFEKTKGVIPPPPPPPPPHTQIHPHGDTLTKLWFAGEEPNSFERAVILPDGLVQFYTGPLTSQEIYGPSKPYGPRLGREGGGGSVCAGRERKASCKLKLAFGQK